MLARTLPVLAAAACGLLIAAVFGSAPDWAIAALGTLVVVALMLWAVERARWRLRRRPANGYVPEPWIRRPAESPQPPIEAMADDEELPPPRGLQGPRHAQPPAGGGRPGRRRRKRELAAHAQHVEADREALAAILGVFTSNHVVWLEKADFGFAWPDSEIQPVRDLLDASRGQPMLFDPQLDDALTALVAAARRFLDSYSKTTEDDPVTVGSVWRILAGDTEDEARELLAELEAGVAEICDAHDLLTHLAAAKLQR